MEPRLAPWGNSTLPALSACCPFDSFRRRCAVSQIIQTVWGDQDRRRKPAPILKPVRDLVSGGFMLAEELLSLSQLGAEDIRGRKRLRLFVCGFLSTGPDRQKKQRRYC